MTTTTRRDFLKTIGLATVCACTGMAALNGCSMIKGVSATETIPDYAWKHNDDGIIIDLAKSECLALPGVAGKLSVDTGDEKPIKLIVVHYKEGQFKVFSDCCTHGGRELNYLHEEGKLQCSSFGHSEFSMKGQAIKGPAEGPLAVYPVEKLNHNTLIINVV
jgi:Rieske Fe-S protein